MKVLFDAFEKANKELFFVGGCIRDQLLGVEPDDYDFATNARPQEIIEVLENAGLPSYTIGAEFGTIQTIIDDEKVEITTYRCAESYTKGSRKPSVKFGDFVKEDLARRDFTFNAIARASDGSLVDPFGGESDLRDGIIRTPLDATTAGLLAFGAEQRLRKFKGLYLPMMFVKSVKGDR